MGRRRNWAKLRAEDRKPAKEPYGKRDDRWASFVKIYFFSLESPE